jgi:hypothetical protein
MPRSAPSNSSTVVSFAFGDLDESDRVWRSGMIELLKDASCGIKIALQHTSEGTIGPNE